jgi:hypothetical protein
MLLSLALCGLAAAPAGTPRTSVEHAGFLRDARVKFLPDARLAFEARVQWPPTVTRTSFVVEGLGPDGALLFSRPAAARTEAPAGQHLTSVAARFELELPPLAGVAELRVRLRN